MRKGEKRKEQILDVCVQLLVEQGYSELSFRKVAKRTGIQVGNLQYHFPTRADLIRAMLARELDRYNVQFKSWAEQDEGRPPTDLLLKSVDYLLQDQTNQYSCIIFWELWAMAAHDLDAANLMNEYYQSYLGIVAEGVAEVRPELTRARVNKAALMIVSLIEGLSLFRGHQRPRIPAIRGIEMNVKATILSIIEAI